MPQPWTTWIAHLRRWGRRCLRLGRSDARPVGPVGVAKLGHREYVGGRWDEIGRLQFDFLLAHGLRPEHVLLDVACGSLRAGVHLIPYLNSDHYWGLEKERELVAAGLERELDPVVRELKHPNFLRNAEFDVTGMSQPADFIWIHSLWTHLPLDVIQRCLLQIKLAATKKTVCFATFFEARTRRDNLAGSHDHETFFYTLEELTTCGTSAGWDLDYIGDWGHPRGQRMVKLTLAEQRSEAR